MIKQASQTFDLLQEIFGCGYDLSYRWCRFKELMILYLEWTIIPAIVLGSLTNFGCYILNYFKVGYPFITSKEFFGLYLLFFAIMILEDLVCLIIVGINQRFFNSSFFK